MVRAGRATATDIVADDAGAGLVVLGPEWSPREAPGAWWARVLLDDQPTGAVVLATRDMSVGRLAEVSDVVARYDEPMRAGVIVLLDSFGTSAPWTSDGRHATEVDGRVVASSRFGASGPYRPEAMS